MRSRGDDADLPEDVLRVRPGPALAAVAGELALDEVRLQIEEEEDLGVDLACEDRVEQRPKRGLGDRPAPEPGDDVVDDGRLLEAGERKPDVLPDDPAGRRAMSCSTRQRSGLAPSCSKIALAAASSSSAPSMSPSARQADPS